MSTFELTSSQIPIIIDYSFANKCSQDLTSFLISQLLPAQSFGHIIMSGRSVFAIKFITFIFVASANLLAVVEV